MTPDAPRTETPDLRAALERIAALSPKGPFAHEALRRHRLGPCRNGKGRKPRHAALWRTDTLGPHHPRRHAIRDVWSSRRSHQTSVRSPAVTRILAGIAIGTFAGVLVLLSLLWKPQRVRARPCVESEDGLPVTDPYLVAMAAARSGTLRASHIRDIALAASGLEGL